jgi:hypothetical protein
VLGQHTRVHSQIGGLVRVPRLRLPLSGLLEAGHQVVGSSDQHFLCKVEGEFSQGNIVTHHPRKKTQKQSISIIQKDARIKSNNIHKIHPFIHQSSSTRKHRCYLEVNSYTF